MKLRSDFQAEYQILEITENIINSGIKLAEIHGLRGYDAIQLAAGCAVNVLCIANNLPSIIFVSADNELNMAASSEGLFVENPNNHSQRSPICALPDSDNQITLLKVHRDPSYREATSPPPQY